MPRKTPADDGPSVGSESAASMRPRPDAAENVDFPVLASRLLNGFNEAAARCRGKLGSPRPCQAHPKKLQ